MKQEIHGQRFGRNRATKTRCRVMGEGIREAGNQGSGSLAYAGLSHPGRQRRTAQGAPGDPVSHLMILVGQPWQSDGHQSVPLGHASLLARLSRESGFVVRSIVQSVADRRFSVKELAAEIAEASHSFQSQSVDVALGAYVWNDPAVRELVRQLRLGGFRGRIILGGPQITYAGPGLELLYPGVDVFVRGAGEEALSALGRGEEPSTVRGVHVAGEPDSLDQASADLQNLPSPWLTGILDPRTAKSVHWETQRGCQFSCSFCQHRNTRSGAAVVTAGAHRIFPEIELFCDACVPRISVLDPVFNRDDRRSAEILEGFLKRGFAGEISLQCRAEFIDPRNSIFLDAAERLNVTLEFGLQSVGERELDAVQRRNNMQRIDAVLAEVRRRGIRHEVSLIYGLPEQTVDSFRSSVDWCLQRRVPVIRAFPLLLLRGTALHRERARWHLTTRDGLLPIVNTASTFDEEGWRQMDAIAAALAATAGHHPDSVEGLAEMMPDLALGGGQTELRVMGRPQ